MTARVRPTLVFKLPQRAGFASSLVDHAGNTAVFVPGTSDLAPGSVVDLNVVFEDEPRTFRTRGTVRWKRESLGHALPPGIAIELAALEHATRDLILAYTRGQALDWHHRREPRLPVIHPLSFAVGEYLANEITEDLSKGGAFISSARMLPVGSEIDIKLKPDGELFALRFSGVVVWQTQARGGLGVRFVFPNPHVKQRFESFVDRLSEQIDSGFEVHGPQGRL